MLEFALTGLMGERFFFLGGGTPPSGNNAILRANGESGGKIVPAVLLTFQWLLNSEETKFVSKAVPEI